MSDELQFNLLENALDSVDYEINLLVYEKTLTNQVGEFKEEIVRSLKRRVMPGKDRRPSKTR